MFGKNKESYEEYGADMDLFTIYDTKVGAYDIPSFAINKHDLIRQVINMFNDSKQSNNRFLLNAEDFQIFKIGSFYKKPGILKSHPPEHVANMHELRAVAIQNRPDQHQLGIVPT